MAHIDLTNIGGTEHVTAGAAGVAIPDTRFIAGAVAVSTKKVAAITIAVAASKKAADGLRKDVEGREEGGEAKSAKRHTTCRCNSSRKPAAVDCVPRPPRP